MALFTKDPVVVAETEARKAADTYAAANAKLADRRLALEAAKRVRPGMTDSDVEAAVQQEARATKAVAAAQADVEESARLKRLADERLAEAKAARTAEDHSTPATLDVAIARLEAAAAAHREAIAGLADLGAALADPRVRRLLEADPTSGGRRERLRVLLGDALPIQLRRVFDADAPLPLRPTGPEEGQSRVRFDGDSPRNGQREVFLGGQWVADDAGGAAPAGRRVR